MYYVAVGKQTRKHEVFVCDVVLGFRSSLDDVGVSGFPSWVGCFQDVAGVCGVQRRRDESVNRII